MNSFIQHIVTGVLLCVTLNAGVVQSVSHVWLLMTPRPAAHQAPLSFIISQSLLKLMSIESMMPSNHLILCHNLLFLPSVFPMSHLFPSGGQSIGASALTSVLPMNIQGWFPFSSVQFSCSVVSNSLQPHELQHARPPCPSPTPRVYPNSCPLSQWCHPTISSSVVPFSSALNLSQHQGLFKWVRSSHQVTKELEFQLQHQSYQWIPRTNLF